MSENNNLNNLNNDEISEIDKELDKLYLEKEEVESTDNLEATENFQNTENEQKEKMPQSKKDKIVGYTILCVIAFVLLVICVVSYNNNKNTKTTDVEETTTTQSLDLEMNRSMFLGDVTFKFNSQWTKLDDIDGEIFTYVANDRIFINYEYSDTPEILIDTKYDANMTLGKGDEIDNIDRIDYGDYEAVDYSYRSDDGTDKRYHHLFMFYYHKTFYKIWVWSDLEYTNDCEDIFYAVRYTIKLENNYNDDEEDYDEDYDDDYDDDIEETKKQTVKPYNNSSTNGFSASGTGDFVAKGLEVKNYAVLTINYTDATDSHFSVISYEGDEYDDLLVNTIGNYSGKVLIEHSGTFDLEVKSNGSWSISSSGLSVDNVSSFSGTGDAVTGITTHTGGSWEITNNGSGHFSVIEYGVSEGYLDLLANETGSYSGVVKASAEDDNIFFKVTSDGSWSIKKQ